jgi:hypothetical protein
MVASGGGSGMIDKETLQLLQRRKLLDEHPDLRSRAIADFVLSVAQTAAELNKLLVYKLDYGLRAESLDDNVAYLTEAICLRFRQCLGQELFEQQKEVP